MLAAAAAKRPPADVGKLTGCEWTARERRRQAVQLSERVGVIGYPLEGTLDYAAIDAQRGAGCRRRKRARDVDHQ